MYEIAVREPKVKGPLESPMHADHLPCGWVVSIKICVKK